MSHTLIIKQKSSQNGPTFPEFELFDTETGKKFEHVTRCTIELNAAQQPIVNISFIPDRLDVDIDGLIKQEDIVFSVQPPIIEKHTMEVRLAHSYPTDEPGKISANLRERSERES